MTLKPLVSVCMITYNHEKYIVEAIEGVLMQVCDFDIELIIADDCSPDKTMELVSQIQNNHIHGYWIKYTRHQTNKGMMPNFVWALQQCKGKYIALCEGDDYWIDPLKLQKQVDFLEANDNFSGCFHNTMLLNESHLNADLKPWRLYNKIVFELEDTISTVALFHTSSFMFRKASLNLPNWFTKVQSGDMALFALVASKGLLYRFDGYMSVYRKNETGITNSITPKSYHKNRIVLHQFFKGIFDISVHGKIDEVINFHTKELTNVKGNFLYKWLKKIKSKLKKLYH